MRLYFDVDFLFSHYNLMTDLHTSSAVTPSVDSKESVDTNVQNVAVDSNLNLMSRTCTSGTYQEFESRMLTMSSGIHVLESSRWYRGLQEVS